MRLLPAGGGRLFKTFRSLILGVGFDQGGTFLSVFSVSGKKGSRKKMFCKKMGREE